jgi:hypothetical protein
MFDKKLTAQAEVLLDDGPRFGHGTAYENHTYALEVRPQGKEPFRAEAELRVIMFTPAPQRGDIVNVVYEEKNHKTEIVIAGDPRFDPKLVREMEKQVAKQQRAQLEAVLRGGNPPSARKR